MLACDRKSSHFLAILGWRSAPHWDRGLVELEAEVFDHAVRVGGFLTRCREIAVDEDRIRGVKAQRLQRAQVYFSAAGDANFFVWIDEAEQAKRL